MIGSRATSPIREQTSSKRLSFYQLWTFPSIFNGKYRNSSLNTLLHLRLKRGSRCLKIRTLHLPASMLWLSFVSEFFPHFSLFYKHYCVYSTRFTTKPSLCGMFHSVCENVILEKNSLRRRLLNLLFINIHHAPKLKKILQKSGNLSLS